MKSSATGLLVLLTACGATAAPSPDADVPAPAAFDLALVKSNFADECTDPIAVDETFCLQVDIDGMTADGTILIVPTTLSAIGMEPRAAVICDVLARVHFDGATGEDLGYRTIGIRDRDGANAAACSVAP